MILNDSASGNVGNWVILPLHSQERYVTDVIYFLGVTNTAELITFTSTGSTYIKDLMFEIWLFDLDQLAETLMTGISGLLCRDNLESNKRKLDRL